jgi:hypothetical protein
VISFDLRCGAGHQFEGWFSSSHDYDGQRASGHLACPLCNDMSVEKMLSVPNVGRKGNQPSEISKFREAALPSTDAPSASGQMVNAGALPQALVDAVHKIAEAQSEMLKNSQWVGGQFAETARAIHYGEAEERLIHGEASRKEAEALADEGVAIAPLPFPFIPPEAKN